MVVAKHHRGLVLVFLHTAEFRLGALVNEGATSVRFPLLLPLRTTKRIVGSALHLASRADSFAFQLNLAIANFRKHFRE